MKYLFGQTKKGTWELIRQVDNPMASIKDPVSAKYLAIFGLVVWAPNNYIWSEYPGPFLTEKNKINLRNIGTQVIRRELIPDELKVWSLLLGLDMDNIRG